MILHTFEHSFEELEIFPGIFAQGDADILLENGRFTVTGISTGTGPSARTLSGSDNPIWKMIEAKLLEDRDALFEAYDRDQERQREANRWSERSYAYGR